MRGIFQQPQRENLWKPGSLAAGEVLIMSGMDQIELKNGDYILPADRKEKTGIQRLRQAVGI